MSLFSRKLSVRFAILVAISLSAVILVPSVPRAHADTCAGPCSLTVQPPRTNSLAIGTLFTLNLTVTNMPFDTAGWDIQVVTDNTVISPQTIMLCNTTACNAPYSDSGGTNFIPSGTDAQCINGVASGAFNPCGGNDGPGVAHDSFASSGFTGGAFLLFTITYKVIASGTSNVVLGANLQSPEAQTGTTNHLFDTSGIDTIADQHGGTYGSAPASLISVVTGTDGTLYFLPFAGTWNAPVSLGGKSPSAPALCETNPGTVELVVRAADNTIQHKSFTGTAFAPNWDSAGGQTLDAPSCAVLSQTTLYVVVRGVNNQIYYNTFSLSARTWGAWTNIGGFTNTRPTVVATSSLNRVDVLVVGLDSNLYHQAIVNGAPSGVWDKAPNGILSTVPAAVSDGTGIDVVVRGVPLVTGGTNGPVWFNRYTFSSASWGCGCGTTSGWQFLNGYTTTAPAMTIDSTGALQIAVTGLNSNVYTISKPSGGAFSPWTNLGGITSSVPTIAGAGTSRIILVRGSSNIVESILFNGSAWGTFTDTAAIGSTDPIASSAA